jgi:hypothetical protein
MNFTKLNAKFPWPPIMPKQREYILRYEFEFDTSVANPPVHKNQKNTNTVKK